MPEEVARAPVYEFDTSRDSVTRTWLAEELAVAVPEGCPLFLAVVDSYRLYQDGRREKGYVQVCVWRLNKRVDAYYRHHRVTLHERDWCSLMDWWAANRWAADMSTTAEATEEMEAS